MDQVEIWAVDGPSNVVQLESRGQTDTEWLLEETLVRNPNLLMRGLRLVGRQTPTAGGPLDLLGVDIDGRLVLFELKRGVLSRDAVAQIIHYAADLDGMDLDALARHISERSGSDGIREIEDFEEWYGQEFDEQGLETLKPMRLFLVGLGADDQTEGMVRFLANNSGMDISLLTFHGFTHEGKTLLARQVEVEAPTEPGPRRRRRLTTEERRERLEKSVADSGVSDLFYAVREMFIQNWPRLAAYPRLSALSIQLSRRAHVRIDVWKGAVGVIFLPRAKELCPDEFRQPLKEIRYQTWPKEREPLDDPDSEIWFKLNPEEWETHRERLHALTRAVYEAWASSEAAP